MVTAEIGRGAGGRLRGPGTTAALALGVPADRLDHLERVRDGFEAFPTVTRSVGIPLALRVIDAHGIEPRPPA